MTNETLRWKCVCAYDGTNYAGWQSQANGLAIQDVIEGALAGLLQRDTRIHGSGRTDAGVHARGQVFHFDASWTHGSQALQRALSTRLPNDVQVSIVRKARADFHARFSATGKRYLYRAFEGQAPPHEIRFRTSLSPSRLDVAGMRLAANSLLGEHDFTSFGASRGDSGPDDPIKTLWVLEIRRTGKRLQIEVEGSGFLYKMVRSLCGALLAVGRGKLEVSAIKKILAQRKRTSKVVTAPPQGLSLDKVYFRNRRS